METTTQAKFFGRLPVAMLGVICLATGCASKPDKVNAVATVEQSRQRVEATNDFITKADNRIIQFEKDMKDLRADARKSNQMRGKNNFESALRRLDGELQGARLQLRNLKAANVGSWNDFRARLDDNLREMSDSFDSSTAAE